MVNVNNFGIANVRAVFLKCDAQNKNLSILHHHSLFIHTLDGLVGHVITHTIIQATGIAHHTGQNTIDLCFLYQIIGVNADAVTSHQSWTEFDEVPLAGSGLNHIACIDAHRIENLRQLVHESDVHITLTVLNNLAGLCYLDARGFMGAVDKDTVINLINIVGNLRR